jgi:hypothetical protein
MVNLSDFYSYRLIGKLTAFFTVSGAQKEGCPDSHQGGSFTYYV